MINKLKDIMIWINRINLNIDGIVDTKISPKLLIRNIDNIIVVDGRLPSKDDSL